MSRSMKFQIPQPWKQWPFWMIPIKFVLERTSDIKTKANLSCCWRQKIKRSGFLGECLRVYHLVSVHWSLFSVWNVRSTQMQDHLKAPDSGLDHIVSVISYRLLFMIDSGVEFQDVVKLYSNCIGCLGGCLGCIVLNQFHCIIWITLKFKDITVEAIETGIAVSNKFTNSVIYP